MKTFFITTTLLLISFVFRAQESEFPHLLATDSTWFKEIIPFPPGFAQEFPLVGYEDAQFLPGWGKRETEEFWSYLLVWKIKQDQVLSEQELETNMEAYMDGLMKAVNKDSTFTVPLTNALFMKESTGYRNHDYVGKIKVYDSFRTTELITLHTFIDIRECPDTNNTIYIFRISLQPFDHDVWKQLNGVKLLPNHCD
ncbi:MAG: hypothetical protein K0U54_07885 [Bacteroidetes bacterium]|nr:hypothetical protein [Bacteroidota bacterium]